MTAMREEAFELLEKMPEDKLVFIIQIMQGVNSLYNSCLLYTSPSPRDTR